MSEDAGATPLRQIRDGYGSLLLSFAHTLLFLLIILGLSLAITLPLWYFALNFRDAFTAIMLLLIGSYLLIALGHRIRTQMRNSDTQGQSRLRVLGGKMARVLGVVAFIYLFLVLLSGPLPLLTLPYTIIGLLALGYIFFVRRR